VHGGCRALGLFWYWQGQQSGRRFYASRKINNPAKTVNRLFQSLNVKVYDAVREAEMPESQLCTS
jgi:hypothetical protein